MRFCKRGKELKRNRRVFTEFLVVDLADNPIAHFPTREEAEDYVEYEAKGCRIVEVNLNGTTTIISNKVFNSAHQFREEGRINWGELLTLCGVRKVIKRMGLEYMGKSEVTTPTRCSWCGEHVIDLVKIRSHEDKSTLRICTKHWNTMAQNAREWDNWVARKFPKWGVKVMGKDWYINNNLANLIEKKRKK